MTSMKMGRAEGEIRAEGESLYHNENSRFNAWTFAASDWKDFKEHLETFAKCTMSGGGPSKVGLTFSVLNLKKLLHYFSHPHD